MLMRDQNDPDFTEEIRWSHCAWKVRALHGRTSVPFLAHGLGVLGRMKAWLVSVGKGVAGIMSTHKLEWTASKGRKFITIIPSVFQQPFHLAYLNPSQWLSSLLASVFRLAIMLCKYLPILPQICLPTTPRGLSADNEGKEFTILICKEETINICSGENSKAVSLSLLSMQT